MLSKPISERTSLTGRSRQGGVVMMVALVVLVVMTLAGIGLMRSMDTTNLIAGNMAFKQSATHSGDSGVEIAIAWLEANKAFLNAPQPVGYTPMTPSNTGLGLGQAYWDGLKASGVCNLPMVGGVCSATAELNPVGNRVSFMIQRLCKDAGPPNPVSCPLAPGTLLTSGENEGAGEDLPPPTATALYYRITVRVEGQRNAVSFVQAIVSL